jgi:hypothetical protein
MGFDEHLWEDSESELNPYKLPAKYIKGYIDVDKRKLVLNPNFEENPDMPRPIIVDSEEFKRKKQDIPAQVPEASSEQSTEIW